MNEEANDHDEFIEAPEEDEFGDYEPPENENPEAVQAMIGGGPNWVFPDLVRVQSNNGIIDAVPSGVSDVVNSPRTTQPQDDLAPSNGAPPSRTYAGGAIPRNSQHPRILDPPDVSLLSSNPSTSITVASNQPNTIDLCNTIRQNSKLNFSSNLSNSKNGFNSPATSSINVSSPNSTGSSSSTSSSISTNLSGMILSNSSSSSSSQPNIVRNSDIVASSSSHRETNNYVDYANPTPSTSGSFQSTSTLITGQKLNSLEREIRALEMQKAQLQQQLMQRDDQIDELQQTLSSVHLSNGTHSALEESIAQRINDSFDRLTASLQKTMAGFERRIERLEDRHRSENGVTLSNDSMKNTDGEETDSGQPLAQLLIEMQKRISENQRQEMCSLFRNIFSSAVREIDNFASTNSAAESASFRKNDKTATMNGL